ncbi:MAG: UDP-glucose 4-epimerase GalE [Hyphomonadaceae bacterium]|nr:UDP-glucose 4-epimerase GalE [Hyphomonadaceae bacterium]MBY0565127.1 UDP-glucose 4-epimerase GalE [Hyphomonadaceae bacterium]
MRVLVTGGAGYVGSHVALAFSDAGYEVTIVDRSPRPLKPTLGEYHQIDLLDYPALFAALKDREFECVVHCAALTSLPLSYMDPVGFFTNNISGTLSLLKALAAASTRHFIFSSTAAVYAPSPSRAVDEQGEVGPMTPYGESKLQCERILRFCSQNTGLNVTILRYFNVAGADKQLRAGPNTSQLGALVPTITRAMIAGGPFTINGDCYETGDGTTVRDYIHVADLAKVHLLLNKHRLSDASGFEVFNVGYGLGYSVAEVANAAQSALNGELTVVKGPARPGDLPHVVASPAKLFSTIGPLCSQSRLEDMLVSTHRWILGHGGLLPDTSLGVAS